MIIENDGWPKNGQVTEVCVGLDRVTSEGWVNTTGRIGIANNVRKVVKIDGSGKNNREGKIDRKYGYRGREQGDTE